MNTSENTFQEATEDAAESPKRQGLEVAGSSESGSIHENLGALHQAISHDESITEDSLDNLHSAVEDMKINIGGKEVTLKAAEGVIMLNTFLRETNTVWGVKAENLPIFKFEFTDPKELEYKEKAEHRDATRCGEYTLNPETFGINFEKAKVFIPDLSSMNGSKLHVVFKYVVERYGEKYYVPGIEYWKWMIENPDKAEETIKKQKYDIKDGNYYYLPGSSLCSPSGGDWIVPCAYWDRGRLLRRAGRLEREWGWHGEVLLLEK